LDILPVKKEKKLSASEVPGEVVGSGEVDLWRRNLLTICQRQELEWLDVSLNAKKSTCIGPRFNANCCNIVTRDGRELAWTNVVRYLGIFIESASCFKCSLDNAKRAFYRSFDRIFGRVGQIASNDVIAQLVKSKCFPVLFYGQEACSLRKYQHNLCHQQHIYENLQY